MSSVLEAIISNKRLEITAGKYLTSQSQPTVSSRSLAESLVSRAPGLILECKAASPSAGLNTRNYQPQQLVTAYQPFAAAISVLTDESYFQGTMQHLQLVSETTELPVLCKDFFISKQQIICARAHGADAILLMMSVLDDQQYRELAEQAQQLNLDIVTEVRNQQELQRALVLEAQIIGVNNRNLDSLEIDMTTTARLADQIPSHCLLISESGYNCRQQIMDSLRCKRAADGFLIGNHLSAASNVPLAVRKLLFGEVKICGLKKVTDAQTAFDQGASYGGLIFAENSPRKVSLSQAEKLVTSVALDWVGVFVEFSLSRIVKIVQQLNLAVVQLHCHVSAEHIKQLRQLLPQSCEIWLLIKVAAGADELPDGLFNNEIINRYLVEPAGTLAGGNGLVFDWTLLKSSSSDRSKIILAGGINPDNVHQAMATGAGMLDINSGVENAVSIKSAKKIKQLFQQLLPGQQS